MYFKPIFPLKGATISVCFMFSFNNSISALIAFKSVKEISYASVLTAPFSNNILFLFSVSNFSFLFTNAFDNCACKSPSYIFINCLPLAMKAPSVKPILTILPCASARNSTSSSAIIFPIA